MNLIRLFEPIAVILLFLTTTLSAASGAEKTPFYQGKTLNIVINFAAGGPTDIESRIFAKHLPRHIPGQPSVMVQNMGGGGGLTGMSAAMAEVASVVTANAMMLRIMEPLPPPW